MANKLNVAIAIFAFANLAKAIPLSGQEIKCGSPAIPPDTSSNIVGGKDAIPYSWPWQVALVSAQTGGQFCGGALISSQWVLSAGHCFFPDKTPKKYRVKLGVFDKTKKSETGEIISDIVQIERHPKFKWIKTLYDVSLVKLKNPVEFTDHISPVCLPAKLDEELPVVGTPTFVTGWGDTSFHGHDSPTLKQVSVPVASIEKCNASYNGTISGDCMFCAGLDEGGKDSCNGDSGGPLMFQDPVNNGTWKQLGIVSWGLGCAEPNYYGVYSKVSAYIDFIHQYVTDLPAGGI